MECPDRVRDMFPSSFAIQMRSPVSATEAPVAPALFGSGCGQPYRGMRHSPTAKRRAWRGSLFKYQLGVMNWQITKSIPY